MQRVSNVILLILALCGLAFAFLGAIMDALSLPEISTKIQELSDGIAPWAVLIVALVLLVVVNYRPVQNYIRKLPTEPEIMIEPIDTIYAVTFDPAIQNPIRPRLSSEAYGTINSSILNFVLTNLGTGSIRNVKIDWKFEADVYDKIKNSSLLKNVGNCNLDNHRLAIFGEIGNQEWRSFEYFHSMGSIRINLIHAPQAGVDSHIVTTRPPVEIVNAVILYSLAVAADDWRQKHANMQASGTWRTQGPDQIQMPQLSVTVRCSDEHHRRVRKSFSFTPFVSSGNAVHTKYDATGPVFVGANAYLSFKKFERVVQVVEMAMVMKPTSVGQIQESEH